MAVPLLGACTPTPTPPQPTPALRPGQAAAGRAPTADQLSVLLWSHFVPEFDKWFDAFAQDWGAKNNVQVRVDHVPQAELPARASAELASQAGHDIIQFVATGGPHLYARHLDDLDDLMNRLDQEQGGWEPAARNLALVNGHWKGFPDYFMQSPILYREDLFRQEGLAPPDTWDDVLEGGRRLKAKGYPGGIGFVGNHVDANVTSHALLWSFGATTVREDGLTVALDSPETREALKFGKALYEAAMTDEVFNWDDTSNNRALAEGRASYVHNAISAYLTIRKENPALAANIGIVPIPKGPRDRRTGAWSVTLGIWKFAKNRQVAHRFLADYATRWMDGLKASAGYDHPLLKGWGRKPIPGLSEDPKLTVLQDLTSQSSFMGYPGPVTAAADEVWQAFLIPQMFAKYIRGGELDVAVRSTEEAIRKVYAKWQA
jgi:multiple sugar transport system substrate-binding protein